MRRIGFVLGALALLLSAQPAQSMLAYTPGAGLAGTPHDFTQNYTVTSSLGVGLVGECTMCHTPHKAQSTRLLWNHTNSGSTWSWSDATQTAAGTDLTAFTAAWTGTSPKCLSCHDGTVAVGDIAWYDAQKQTLTVGAGSSGVTLTGGGMIGDTAFVITGNGAGGGNLAGNHPIAIPYPVGQVANTYRTITNGSGLVGTDFQADPTQYGVVLYKDAGSAVTRVLASATGTTNGIECSSCHDAHNKGGADSDDYLLRGKLTGSDTHYICLKCHIK